MAKAPRKTHSFTITVTAPSFLTKRDVAREVRTLVNEQCNHLAGKHVGEGFNSDWIEVSTDSIRVRSID